VTAAYAAQQPAEEPAVGGANDPKAGDQPPTAPTSAPAIVGVGPSAGGPLGLEEVLSSVERNYPLLRAVEQERAIAGGRLISSLGVFDLNLDAGTDGQGTTYDGIRNSVGVSQGLPYGGIGLFAGYRNGLGEFPTYKLGDKTADGGEFRAGVLVPLLRNREIDSPRATVQKARLDVRLAEPTIERQRLDFQQAAGRTYWSWVGAGQRLRVAERLVKLAVDRDQQLKDRVAAEATARIERVDNQQNIAQRNGVLVQAQRGFQKATIELSLFLRDGTGSPTLAGIDRLPAFPDLPSVDIAIFPAALQTALELRPEPRRLRLQRDKLVVDLRLANNMMLPTLNAVVAASQDVGPGKSSLSGPNGLETSTVGAGLSFQLPVQRRDARGRIAFTQAQLAQLEQQLRFTEDAIRAEVQDTFSALERAAEFHRQAEQRVELVRLVASAERDLLRIGRSDVLRVTLREQAAFDAEVVEIGARQEYFRSLVEFRAAVGIGGR
jgi:outer membrane protein TolC